MHHAGRLSASIYACDAAIYAGHASMYTGNAAIYADNSAVYGDKGAIYAVSLMLALLRRVRRGRAAKEGHKKAVRALLRAHADVNLQNEEGKTPLHLAEAMKQEEVAGYLIEKGTPSTSPPVRPA